MSPYGDSLPHLVNNVRQQEIWKFLQNILIGRYIRCHLISVDENPEEWILIFFFNWNINRLTNMMIGGTWHMQAHLAAAINVSEL